MLDELRIRGLGVIDDATLPLGPGLTVVTGETGAGKTMVVSGLLLLFGGRGDAARVRAGADQASVDGRLSVAPGGPVADRVRSAGGDLDDGTALVLRRTVGANGRSRAHVGGAPTPVSVLGELSERLIAVHGQSDQLRLTQPAQQRAALDRYAGIDLTDFGAAFAAWRDAAQELEDRRRRAGELRRESDMLTHGLGEIEAADPQPGEDVELTALAGRLAHADALRQAARTAHDLLVGDADDPSGDAADVSGLIGAARRALSQQDGADPQLDALAVRGTELAALCTDLGADLAGYLADLEADPERLEQTEARRAVLNTLIRKYGADDATEPSLDAVAEWARSAARRLAEIDVSDEAIAELVARRDEAAARVAGLAAELRRARTAAAQRLAAAVTDELRGLAMPRATCVIEVRARAVTAGLPAVLVDAVESAVTADGADEVELLLRPHDDSPALPIARGASGGELSRVMLALEVCLAGTDPVPTMVFDEVDAGVGGRAALEVGRRLAALSREHQVVVVTHLAQVAAYADRHVVVDKFDGGARQGPEGGTPARSGAVTASDVRVVTGEERLSELARMLGGRSTGTALEHAAELLREASAVTAGAAGAGKPRKLKSAKSRR